MPFSAELGCVLGWGCREEEEEDPQLSLCSEAVASGITQEMRTVAPTSWERRPMEEGSYVWEMIHIASITCLVASSMCLGSDCCTHL